MLIQLPSRLLTMRTMRGAHENVKSEKEGVKNELRNKDKNGTRNSNLP